MILSSHEGQQNLQPPCAAGIVFGIQFVIEKRETDDREKRMTKKSENEPEDDGLRNE